MPARLVGSANSVHITDGLFHALFDWDARFDDTLAMLQVRFDALGRAVLVDAFIHATQQHLEHFLGSGRGALFEIVTRTSTTILDHTEDEVRLREGHNRLILECIKTKVHI